MLQALGNTLSNSKHTRIPPAWIDIVYGQKMPTTNSEAIRKQCITIVRATCKPPTQTPQM